MDSQVRSQPVSSPRRRAARQCGPCACGSAPRRSRTARSMPAACSRMANCPARGKFKSGSSPKPSVDEDGPPAATHHDDVQRPVESVWRQVHVLQPGRPDGRVRRSAPTSRLVIGSTPSLITSTSISPTLQRVARRNQLVERRSKAGLCHDRVHCRVPFSFRERVHGVFPSAVSLLMGLSYARARFTRLRR